MMELALLDKVFDFTDVKALFSAPCHVLLGVSGGADSMALLHMLLHWPKPGLKVSAIHVHHGLRGDAADNDEDLVRRYCADHSVPLTVIHSDVAVVAQKNHLTIEEAGRRVRYESFESVRTAVGADYVLTAHTVSDQVETVLMHLIRGCGVDGIAGIPVIREKIRRPLLCCTRAEIEAYCATHTVPYVLDESNMDTVYTRNAIRHEVLPVLRQINPSVDDAVLRASCHAAEDVAFLNELAKQSLTEARVRFGYSADLLSALPTVVRRRSVRLMFSNARIPSFEERHILAADEVIRHRSGAVSLPGGYRFSIDQGVVSVRKIDDISLPQPVTVDAIPCTMPFGDFVCEVFECCADDVNVHKLFLQSAVDYDKIMGKLCVRCRQTGDYLHPCGRGVGKSLKKLMNEWHIPAHKRESYPVLCDDAGVILVPGFSCDERVKITDNTRRILVCRITGEQGRN